MNQVNKKKVYIHVYVINILNYLVAVLEFFTDSVKQLNISVF
jgi:hypothetical protein